MKKRLNWVDVCIIILIIGVCFVGYKLLNKKDIQIINKTEPIEVTVRVDDISKESENVIQAGDLYKDKDTNEEFGTVIEKKVEDFYDDVETGDGRIVKAKVPGKYTAFVTLKGDAEITDDYIKLGGRDVRLEGTIYLKSNISALEVKVVDIKLEK